MNTGDLILFKGNGVFSALITALPGAEYSHVGVYVDHPEHGHCIFESTSQGTLPDIITGESICGVQLVPFDERVKTYDGEVFHLPIDGERSPDMLEDMWYYIDEYHGTPYEDDNLQLVRAELDLFPWQRNKADASTLFCSENTTMCERYAGLFVNNGTPANENTPTDCVNADLVEGFTYGQLTKVN